MSSLTTNLDALQSSFAHSFELELERLNREIKSLQSRLRGSESVRNELERDMTGTMQVLEETRSDYSRLALRNKVLEQKVDIYEAMLADYNICSHCGKVTEGRRHTGACTCEAIPF